MMTRQSMTRASSASLEADFAPAIQTPFDWEATPGRAARESTKSGFSGNFASAEDSDEMPALPFPPGRRPKDGFYLPYSREFGESLDMQSESCGQSSKPRKLFNLKFPGSSKKPVTTSRMRLPFQSSSKPPKASEESHVDEDQGFRIFNPLSGQRFGSRITNRMLMQFQKKQSLWRRCLPPKQESGDQMKGSSSHMDPNRGRRLDEGYDEGYVTVANSPVWGPSLQSSPRHGHRPWSNSSPIATKKLQVNSSRFMASMLISLCPDDAGDFDRAQLDAEDGNSDDYNDEIGIPHLTSPRTRSSSPEAFEVEVDPASQTMTSQENCTCTCRHRANISARVNSSMPQVNQRGKTSRSVSRSLYEELAAAKSPTEHSRSGKLVLPRSRGAEDSANQFKENNAADRTDSADVHPMFFKASSNREFLRRMETCKSSFSWKPCIEKSRPNQEPVADSVVSDSALEPSDSEFGEELVFDYNGKEFERRGKSSSPEFNSLHKTAWPQPNSLSTSISKDVDIPVSNSKNGVSHSMIGYLSPPRISFEDLKFISKSDKPMAFARWRSTAEPSVLRRSSLQAGGWERKQLPATRVGLSSGSPLQKQALQWSVKPSKIRIKDLKKTAKSSSLRSTPSKALGIGDTDESGDDSDCSTDSSGYETPPAVPSPMLPNFASPKPASLVLSEKLLKVNLHSQLSQREETTLPGPSFNQIMLARSYSVRSSSSRRFTPQEYQAISARTNFRGPSHPAPASRLANTSSSNVVMSKVAQYKSKAAVESSSKSGPLSYT